MPEAAAELEACVRDAADAVQAAADIEGCLAGRYPYVRAIGEDGEMPVVLASVGFYRTCMNYHFVLWLDSGSWRSQILAKDHRLAGWALPRADPTRFDARTPDPPLRQQRTEAGLFLSAIYTVGDCGSGPPSANLLLLRFDEGAWAIAWNSDNTTIARLGSARLWFEGEGIGHLRVTGSSWPMDDEKSQILAEHKLGPYRSFSESWELDGDQYVRVEQRVQPSAFNTLVEFVYALRNGDDAAASLRVVDPSLVERAKGLGLDRPPPDGRPWWGTDAWRDEAQRDLRGPIQIKHYFSGEPVCTVQFVERDGDWLISAIDAAPGPRTGLGRASMGIFPGHPASERR